MTEDVSSPTSELDGLLLRLDSARQALMDILGRCGPGSFSVETPQGNSIKRVMERTVDDLNFYYGRLVARAVSLPQPPCLEGADFASLREATMSLQVAHRRFSNLLHDLIPADLDRSAVDDEHSSYSLRQVLEMAAAHYSLRAQQLANILAQAPGDRP